MLSRLSRKTNGFKIIKMFRWNRQITNRFEDALNFSKKHLEEKLCNMLGTCDDYATESIKNVLNLEVYL
jgi:hypothetical protein